VKGEKTIIIDLDKAVENSKIESNKVREETLNRLIGELRRTWNKLVEQAKRELGGRGRHRSGVLASDNSLYVKTTIIKVIK